MWHYYLLLLFASILFSSQFAFTKCYQKTKGGSFFYSLVFGLITALVSIFIFLAINSFRFEISWFSLALAALYAVNGIVINAFSTKALTCADLSLFSLFMLLGGMVIPFFYGVCVGEEVTFLKVVAVIAVTASLFVSLERDKNKKLTPFALLCMIIVFVTNGLGGVITAYHQSGVESAISTPAFLVLQNLVRFALTSILIVALMIRNEIKTGYADGITPEKSVDGAQSARVATKSGFIAVGAAVGFAAVNGVGNLFTTYSAANVPASLLYPIITGLGVVFSALFGLIFGEKITVRKIIAAALVIFGTVLMVF